MAFSKAWEGKTPVKAKDLKKTAETKKEKTSAKTDSIFTTKEDNK